MKAPKTHKVTKALIAPNSRTATRARALPITREVTRSLAAKHHILSLLLHRRAQGVLVDRSGVIPQMNGSVSRKKTTIFDLPTEVRLMIWEQVLLDEQWSRLAQNLNILVHEECKDWFPAWYAALPELTFFGSIGCNEIRSVIADSPVTFKKGSHYPGRAVRTFLGIYTDPKILAVGNFDVFSNQVAAPRVSHCAKLVDIAKRTMQLECLFITFGRGDNDHLIHQIPVRVLATGEILDTFGLRQLLDCPNLREILVKEEYPNLDRDYYKQITIVLADVMSWIKTNCQLHGRKVEVRLV